jgi:hypothetical protein
LSACLMALLLTGCATSGAGINYCDLAGPVFISKQDQLTDETARQLLQHNETWKRNCKK